MHWDVPVELSNQEQKITKHLTRIGKFYLFLRQVRHQLFDETFEAELAKAYKPRGVGPLPPALLAMVTLLQGYDQVGDAEAVLSTMMDKRWQLVLDCLDCDKAPFSQGVLPDFRKRMIAHGLDQKLLDRTVELAKATGMFGWQRLKVVLDSSPLVGAGRVEDTWNLIGRAMFHVAEAAAKALEVPQDEVVEAAGLTLLGGPSVKARLDIDWNDAAARQEALRQLIAEAEALKVWVTSSAPAKLNEQPLKEALALLERLIAQDTEPDPNDQGVRLRQGVAKDRIPSVGDPEMRHGRKSRSKTFTGYKRHVAKDADSNLVLGAQATPANAPEDDMLAPLVEDARRHGTPIEVKIDRAYLSSPAVKDLRKDGVQVSCKPWPLRNGGLFTKEDFDIRLEEGQVICPAGVSVQLAAKGSKVQFPANSCGPCALRQNCTKASVERGRSVSIHPQEALLEELRAEVKTPEGRERLRERVSIEHTLAKVEQVQGPRARYKGTRKNTLDLRRCGAVVNLQVIACRQSFEEEKAA